MELSRIVVPIVFSENCRGAARYAAALADRFGSELVLLHVAEPVESFLGLEPGFALTDVARARNEALLRDLNSFYFGDGPRDAAVRRVLLEGDPATEIVRCANAQAAGLVVMPTRGFGSFRRFLVGSTTAKVLHDSRCPVWTGVHLDRGLVPAEIRVRNVVAAVDLGPQTGAVLAWGAELAKRWAAELTLVHCLTPLEDREWRERAESLAADDLASWQSDAKVQGEARIIFGEPPRAVCETSAALQADVLVIGRGHGCGGTGRLPSQAYTIIREASCPVVSV